MKAKIFFLSYPRHGLWLCWLIVVMKSCKKIWKKEKILEAKKLVLLLFNIRNMHQYLTMLSFCTVWELITFGTQMCNEFEKSMTFQQLLIQWRNHTGTFGWFAWVIWPSTTHQQIQLGLNRLLSCIPQILLPPLSCFPTNHALNQFNQQILNLKQTKTKIHKVCTTSAYPHYT